MQRQPSVVVTSWVDAGWHEAVIDSPVSVTATTTAIKGAAVIQPQPDQYRAGQYGCVGG